MRIQVLQHGTCVWVGSMSSWFDQKNYTLQPSFLNNDFDWLIVMGGGMSLNDDDQYPWMALEEQLIGEAITAGKKVLGICLGAQLMARALGARVYRNTEQEIGWFSVSKTHEVATWLPDDITLLSWHGDCFDVPPQAISFAESDVTPCQGFCVGPKVWALQCHLEAKPGAPELFLSSDGGVLPEGEHVQALKDMDLADEYAQSAKTMMALLDVMDAQ